MKTPHLTSSKKSPKSLTISPSSVSPVVIPIPVVIIPGEDIIVHIDFPNVPLLLCHLIRVNDQLQFRLVIAEFTFNALVQLLIVLDVIEALLNIINKCIYFDINAIIILE